MPNLNSVKGANAFLLGNFMEKHLDSKIRNLQQMWKEYLTPAEPYQLDLWLTEFFKKHKKYGSKDRKFYRDVFFKLLRSHGLYVYLIDKNSAKQIFSKINTSSDLIDYLRSCDLEPLVKLMYGENTPNLSDTIKRLDLTSDVDIAIASSTSLNTASKIKVRLEGLNTDESHNFFNYLTFQPRAWVRLDRDIKIEDLQKEADKAGLEFSIENDQPYFIQNPQIKNLSFFKKGALDFQDLASQKLTHGLPEGFSPKSIWDVCAGAGGKSLSLRKQFPKTRIFSSDIREHKINKLKEKAKKLGITSIKTFVHDATYSFPVNLQKDFKVPSFDLVVIDAPCSSSGVIRRSPDTKLRLEQENISEIAKLQEKILDSAKESLNPGGIIVYSTCSLFKEENEDIASKFVSAHSGFTIISQGIVGSPFYDSDTMFKAIIKKD